jgi:membrane-bound lytic murein transglycosylase B
MYRLCLLFILCFSVISTPAYSAADGFEDWVKDFKKEAQTLGISKRTLDKSFRYSEYNESVIRLDRKQPEGTFTFEKYIKRVVSDVRVKRGKALLTEHKELLDKIAKEYGVQPRFIVTLWGVETSYGRITGNYSVIEALATLAYEGRRAKFFKKELINALKIVDAGHIEADDMLGSWAGAMGQSQFMPSSFLAYAVDYDGDGRKNIWTSLPDTFASIANYLSQSGWNDEWTWGREVKPNKQYSENIAAFKVKKPLSEWQRMGIRKVNGNDLPGASIEASLIYGNYDYGPAFLVYDNLRVLLKWNRSRYFAIAVGILSDKIAYY